VSGLYGLSGTLCKGRYRVARGGGRVTERVGTTAGPRISGEGTERAINSRTSFSYRITFDARPTSALPDVPPIPGQFCYNLTNCHEVGTYRSMSPPQPILRVFSLRFRYGGYHAGIFLVLFLAIALRVWPLSFPVDLSPDEDNVVTRALRMGRDGLNPGFFKYPPLFLYIIFSGFVIRYGAERALDLSSSPQAFADRFFADPVSFFAQARLISVIMGVGVVWLVYLLARRYPMSRRTSSAAALFVAVSPLLVNLSHFSLVDGPALFPFVFSILFSVRYFRKGGRREAFCAGLLAGLATAIKYPSGVAFIGIIVAVLGRARTGNRAEIVGPLSWSGAGLAGGFLIACPWAISDFGTFWPYMSMLGSFVGNPYIAELTQARGYIPYLIELLPNAMGWPLYLAGLAGVIFWIRSDGWKAAIIAAPAIGYWILMGSARNYLLRYSAPMLPALAMGAAWWVGCALKKWPENKTRISLAIIVLVGPAMGISALSNLRLALPDTRDAATEWIEKNVPAGSLIVSESYGPRLAYTPVRARQIVAKERKRNPKSGGKFAYFASNPPIGRPGYRYFVMPLFQDRDGVSRMASDWYDSERVMAEGIEWIVLSSLVSGRYSGRADIFPKQTKFRKWLGRCWVETARFSPLDPAWDYFLIRRLNRRGPILWVYRKMEPFPRSCIGGGG